MLSGLSVSILIKSVSRRFCCRMQGDLTQGPGRVQLMNSLVEKDIAFVKDKITLDAV